MKRFFAIVLMSILMLSAFTGCSGGLLSNIKLPEYTFTPIVYPNTRYEERFLKTDDFVVLDGKLDEPFWEEQNYLSISKDGFTFSITTKFGDQGVYFGIDIKDSKVFVNPAREDWQNTGVELQIARKGAIDRKEAVMLRFTAGELQISSMKGSYADDNVNGYTWDWVPFYVKSYINAKLSDGLISTADCKRLTFELILPWSSLGMSGAGDVVCLPAYNHVDGYTEDDGKLRTHIQYLGDMFTVGTWPAFTEKGSVIERDSTSDTIGDSVVGISKTAGWDLSKRLQNIIRSGEGVQEIWFKNAPATRYTVETTISGAKAAQDEWPSGGIIVADDLSGNGLRIQLFIGYNGSGSEWIKIYDLGRSEPPIAQIDLGTPSGATGTAGCKLKVVRVDTQYFIYVNDRLIYRNTSDFLNNASVAGLYSVGMSAVFSGYSYSEKAQVPSETPAISDVGDIKVGSTGWDIIEDKNTAISSGGYQQILFNKPAADRYDIEVKVSEAKAVNDDWPSVGILVGDDLKGNGIRIQLYTGWKGTGNEQWIKVYNINREEPPIAEVKLARLSGIETTDGAVLRVVRDGRKFEFYVNGNIIYRGESDALHGKGIGGFYSVGCAATFTDYVYAE